MSNVLHKLNVAIGTLGALCSIYTAYLVLVH
jgi:hypothetical protein